MPISYRIYASDPLTPGSPIDYSTPIATVAAGSPLTHATAPLPMPGDVSFAVRAFDDVSALEESNTDARVRIVVDDAGADASSRPASPVGLTVRATAAGTARVTWAATVPASRSRAPATFAVWAAVDAGPGSIDYLATPDAVVVAHGPGGYAATVSGLSDGVAYVVAVRAVNARGDDGGTTTAGVVGSSVGPDAVTGLVAGVV